MDTVGLSHLKRFRCITTGPPQDEEYDGLLFRRSDLDQQQDSIVGTPLLVAHSGDVDPSDDDNTIDRGRIGFVYGSERLPDGRLVVDCAIDRTTPYGVEAVRRLGPDGDLHSVSLGWGNKKFTDTSTGIPQIVYKPIFELSLVPDPDQPGTHVTHVEPDSEEFETYRKFVADILGVEFLNEVSAETEQGTAKGGKAEAPFSNTPQSAVAAVSTVSTTHPNSAPLLSNELVMAAAGVSAPGDPRASSSAAAAAAAAAATASTATDAAPAEAPADAVGAAVSEVDALRQQAAAMQAQMAQMATANAQMVADQTKQAEQVQLTQQAADDAAGDDDPEVIRQVMADHRARVAAERAAMRQNAQALVDKFAADLAVTGKRMTPTLEQRIKQMADNPAADGELFALLAVEAGAASARSASESDAKYQAQKLEAEAAHKEAQVQRLEREKLEGELAAMHRGMGYRNTVNGDNKRGRMDPFSRAGPVAPAPGFDVVQHGAHAPSSAESAAAAAAPNDPAGHRGANSADGAAAGGAPGGLQPQQPQQDLGDGGMMLPPGASLPGTLNFGSFDPQTVAMMRTFRDRPRGGVVGYGLQYYNGKEGCASERTPTHYARPTGKPQQQ